jgi:hypothetical protein
MTGPNDTVSVKVEGLDQFRRELKKLSDDNQFADDLKDANYAVASFVADKARGRASSPLQRKAAQSLKVGRQAARAVVSGGGARFPFFAGAEFGSIRYEQFDAFRGSDANAGYFLYPTIRDRTPEIVDMYSEAIGKITAKAFPN